MKEKKENTRKNMAVTKSKAGTLDNKAADKIIVDIKKMIEQARQKVTQTVNVEMSLLYWRIGATLHKDILKSKRAAYGTEIVVSVARQLTAEYGASFSEKNLRRMVQFANQFPDKKIVVSLVRQLSWTHIIAIIPIEDPLKREFYIQMCSMENWSVRILRERIKSMLYERTAISRKPVKTIQNDLVILKNEKKINPDLVFRDPYILDFLGLGNSNWSEKDLEDSILNELQNFIIELGTDFGFLARQKRITIDQRDYYIDLLFFHRRLKCLVAIDLKLGEFEAAYKGQMELYLRYLDKYEKNKGEKKPIGLILCTGKNHEHVELLQLGKSNIRVAEYLTVLPNPKLLEQKLRKAIKIARQRLSAEYRN